MECYEVNKQIVIPVFCFVDPSDVRTANLSGYHSSNFLNEAEFVDKIIEDVLKKLQDKESIEQKRLVGFDENLASAESFMKVESQVVQILGNWGTGTISKTTLTSAAFENFFISLQKM
ncbi:hypothetical protein K1719_017092 [Acacia pycnantha]|nr:hypothetical protein K1719_017092 [Acacia pycnantha]